MTTLKSKLESYGLSAASIITISEAVNYLGRFDKLPQATKDNIQVISDMYNVFFEFEVTKTKTMLSSIGKPGLRITYLYPDDKLQESQKIIKIKSKKTYMLMPQADNRLELVP